MNDEQRSFDRDSEREEQREEDERQREINSFWKPKERTVAESIMNNIIWGNDPKNPNKLITPDNIDLSPNDPVWRHKPSEDNNDEPF